MIVDTPQFQLRCHVKEYAPDTFDLTIEQCWPMAQKPHWTTITQLNLTSAQLDALAAVLIRR